MNNSGIKTNEQEFYDFEKDIFLKKKVIELNSDIDFGFVYETLNERGPDYIKGVKINFEILEEDGEEMDITEDIEGVNLNLLDIIEMEFEDEKEFENFVNSGELKEKEICVVIISSILNMRAKESKKMDFQQPLIFKNNKDFFIFSYNGEIFQVDKERLNKLENALKVKEIKNFWKSLMKRHTTQNSFLQFFEFYTKIMTSQRKKFGLVLKNLLIV